ncbi:LysR family transcriptional regulator [Planctomycetaceae bacterium SH139]
MLETRQLRYFLTVAETLHFGQAAERLGIAQPPLSKQIRNMESQLGVQLFRRTSRVVELTAAGEQLIPEARLILELIDSFAVTAGQYGQGVLGQLHVGAVSPALDTFLPPIIQQMRTDHPEVQVTLHEQRTAEQLRRLETGQLDIGFIRHYRHDLDGLQSKLIQREPYVLAVCAKHPLAGKKQIHLSELDEAPMIMAPRELRRELHDDIFACLQRAGANIQIIQEATSKRTELALVAAGIGHALVPQSYQVCFPRSDVRYRPLKGELPMIEMLAVWNSQRVSPSCGLLIDKLPELCD